MTDLSDQPQQQWWYISGAAKVEGPVSTQVFISLFTNGLVDGLTIISNDPSVPQSRWLSLSEHPQLSEAARSANAQEHQPEHLTRPSQINPESEHIQQRLHQTHSSSQQFAHESAHESANESANESAHESAPEPPRPTTAQERERKRLARKRARKAARLRSRQNTSIYVTGLPPDATESQVAAFFTKCGIILPNPETGRPRVKLYRNDDGTLKGDALVTYALRPSVENAVSILDGTPFREHQHLLTIKEATFDHKHTKDEDPNEETRKRPRVPIRGRDLVEEALTWSEQPENVKGAPRIVILKNVFDPRSADYDIIRDDMKEGCEACGEIDKLTVFERNAEGAVAVKFTSVEASLKCIDVMNGRWYDGRRLQAAFYDGQSDYTHKETEEERKERERKWEEWLNGKQSTSLE